MTDEITYESMEQMFKDYFDVIASIQGPQDEDRVRAFYAPDFKLTLKVKPGQASKNREEWVKYLCGHAGEYQAVVKWDDPRLGLIIDERKKQACLLMHEEFVEPVTKKPVVPASHDKTLEYRIVIWEFCLDEGKVKQKREEIIRPVVEPI